MEVRIKKRPSISKENSEKEKPLNMTFSAAMFTTYEKDIKQLPPIKRNLRKPLPKIFLNNQKKN
jgi:hypothetical protein